MIDKECDFSYVKLISITAFLKQWGLPPQSGCDAKLEGARMTPGNRCKCAIFMDTGHIHSEWGGHKIFPFFMVGLVNIN